MRLLLLGTLILLLAPTGGGALARKPVKPTKPIEKGEKVETPSSSEGDKIDPPPKAEGEKAEDPTAARKHYAEGTKAFNLGEFQRAITEYRAAYNAKPDPVFLYNIAQAYRLAGDLTNSL